MLNIIPLHYYTCKLYSIYIHIENNLKFKIFILSVLYMYFFLNWLKLIIEYGFL